MDEDIKARLLESMDAVSAWAEAGADFASEQAPLVAEEIVRYGIFGNGIRALILGVIAFALFRGAKAAMKRAIATEEAGRDGGGWAALSLVVGSFSIATAIPSAISAFATIKPIVAPRLYVLEYIANML